MGVEAPRRPNRKFPLSPSETSPAHLRRRRSLRSISIPLHTPWANSIISLLPPASLGLLLGQPSPAPYQFPSRPFFLSLTSVRRRKRRLPAATSLPTTYHRWRRKTPTVDIAAPQPLYHPPASSVRGHQRSESRSRQFFSSFRSNNLRYPDLKSGSSLSGSRLWNPINHVPRTTAVTPRPPQFSDENLPLEGIGRDAYPLLTIPEQRRSRLIPSASSLAVERSVGDTESGRTSIALPRGQRRSEQLERTARFDMANPTSTDLKETDSRRTGQPRAGDMQHPPRHAQSNPSLRASTFASYPSVNGTNSGGGEGEVAEDLAWGPAHPCYPHMNPHVPLHSDEFTTTRVIRIRRDWMVKGDLAPAFSNLYPEILDPLLPEQEFRRVIAKINGELVKTFDPFSLRNWIDGAMGLLTGWIWDDLGVTGIKSHLRRLEEWLDQWNREVGAKEGVQIWSLRRTAYMTLDIQIPDPKVGIVASEGPSAPGTRPSTEFGTGIPVAPEESPRR